MSSSIVEEDGTVKPNFQLDDAREANNEVSNLEEQIYDLEKTINSLEENLQNVLHHDGSLPAVDEDNQPEMCPLGNRLFVLRKHIKGLNARLKHINHKVDI